MPDKYGFVKMEAGCIRINAWQIKAALIVCTFSACKHCSGPVRIFYYLRLINRMAFFTKTYSIQLYILKSRYTFTFGTSLE
jgi:hypothetical protein